MDEAVEDGVGVGRIADGVMPGGDGQLAGDDGGLSAVAILQDLEQVVTGLGIEGLQAPVIEDEEFDLRQALEPAGDAAVAAGERQFLEQARETGVEDRTVVAAGLVADGAGEPGLADDVGMVDPDLAGAARLGNGYAVELLLEDGADRAVVARADLQGTVRISVCGRA